MRRRPTRIESSPLSIRRALDGLRTGGEVAVPPEDSPLIAIIGPDDADLSPLQQLVSTLPAIGLVDHFEEMLEELLYCRRPQLKRELKVGDPGALRQKEEFVRTHLGERHPWAVGAWVYFPWRRVLVRLLPPCLHQELRTARNRGWVETEEQERFSEVAVGIVGLSVGSNVALTLAQEGVRCMKLADFDTLAGTNLNRIRGTFADVGTPKTVLVARQIYELDPFANLTLYPQGVTADNVAGFFDGDPPLDAVIDECDDPITKIRLRLEAKARRIPLFMATDMGDKVILDIERYDLDPDYPLLHGRLGPQPERWLERDVAPQDALSLIYAFLGPDTMPDRMAKVGERLGRDLDGPPQLASTSAMAGGAVSHAVRQVLVNGYSLSGRFQLEPSVVTHPRLVP